MERLPTERSTLVNFQTRFVFAMLLLAGIAISTGSVLLLGYLLAGSSLAMMLAVLIRRVGQHILDARIAKPRIVPRPRAVARESSQHDTRRAA